MALVRLPFVMLAVYIRWPVQILAALLPVQLYATVHGKAMDDCPNSWAPATHVKDENTIPGSWLPTGPYLVTWQPFKKGTNPTDGRFSLAI